MGYTSELDSSQSRVCHARARGGVGRGGAAAVPSLRANEIIHSTQDPLQFRAFVQMLEVHEFTLPDSSSDEGGSSLSDDSYPVYDAKRGTTPTLASGLLASH
jgi:hypothetical protein